MWALHHADEEVEEESSDGEAPEPEMFFLADRALFAAYFPAPAEEVLKRLLLLILIQLS